MKEHKAHRKKLFFAAFTGICLIGVLCLGALYLNGLKERSSDDPVTSAQLEELPLDEIEKIMIVAHPDDETYWGGAHLAQEPYLVVCLTNENNPIRRKEFEQAVSLMGSVPLILNYPDKEWGIRSAWTGYLDDIEEDIAALLSYREWKMVVTHNPDGEYGHIQHKLISGIVTEAAVYFPEEKLYYFGNYYTARELDTKETRGELPAQMSEESYSVKQQMVSLYQSQRKAESEFRHMFPYEEWYSAED